MYPVTSDQLSSFSDLAVMNDTRASKSSPIDGTNGGLSESYMTWV